VSLLLPLDRLLTDDDFELIDNDDDSLVDGEDSDFN
jgi:hypothetical protein